MLYPNPGYPIYESQIEYQSGIAIPYGYTETEKGFALDIEAMESRISDKTTALIYNNYQNPNGAQSTREEMEKVLVDATSKRPSVSTSKSPALDSLGACGSCMQSRSVSVQ